MPRLALAPVFLAVASLACAGSSPPTTRYLLRAEPTLAETDVEPEVRIGLARVRVAHYLDASPGIVVETETGQVRAAGLHEWAEPVSAGVSSFLRTEVSNRLGYAVSTNRVDRSRWHYTIDVYVDRLHGTMQGKAILEATYRVSPAPPGEPREYRMFRSAPLEREGYAGVVEAETVLLRELAAGITRALLELQSTASAETPAPNAP